MSKLISKLIIPPPDVIGNFIGKPPEQWKGNCYCVASKMVQEDVLMTECRAIYGHYLGPISSKSYFKFRKGMPFVHHGWIELPNGDIIDPTRWVFEAKEPYIALIDRGDDVAEEYDEGGNKWREAFQTPPPKYRKGDKQFPFTLNKFDKLDGRTYVLSLFGDKRMNVKEICLDQIFWLANLSLNVLGIYAESVYNYLVGMGVSAFIPIDNRLKILGEENE